MRKSLFQYFVLAVLFSAIGGLTASCQLDSSDDNNSDNNGGGNSGDDQVEYADPTVTIDALDSDIITGSRTLTLTGTVTPGDELSSLSRDNSTASVTVTHNGTALDATLTVAEDGSATWSVDVTLDNRENSFSAVATDEDGNTSAAATADAYYPFFAVTDGQDASFQFGQASLTAYDGGQTAAADTVGFEMWNTPSTWEGMLFIPDFTNNRVLGFDTIPTAAGATANFVIGQTSLTGDTANTTANGLDYPGTAFPYDGQMFLTDFGNNRILIYNSVPTSSNPSADIVVGQADLTSSGGACTATGLTDPEEVFAVDGKLIVADAGCNRVLIWNSIPTADGAAADLVLGQTTMTGSASGLSDSEMDYPTGIWSDGERLVVVDQANNRVLIWNTFPTENGQVPDAVLGQTDFDTATTGCSATTMNTPAYMGSNGNQLFVGDLVNNRVLVWDSIPTASTTAADHVLGQPDLDSCDDPTANTASSLSYPVGILQVGDQLIVSEGGDSSYGLRTVFYDEQ